MFKRIFLSLILLPLGVLYLFAEIQLTPYVSKEDFDRHPTAYQVLSDKLGTIITQSGYTIAPEQSSRFILTAHCNEATKNILGAAPTRISYTLHVILCIGDGVSGTCYKQISVKAKGVGETEDKAYINAMRSLHTNTPNISSFIKEGVKGIITYYESSKDEILSNATQDIVAHNYDDAVYSLSLVPSECSYYSKACDMLVDVYAAKKEYESVKCLNAAKSLWGARQDKAAAEEALSYLAQVESTSSCYKNAITLGNKITQTVAGINAKEWEEHVREEKHRRAMEVREADRKQEQDRLNAQIREKQIKAARDIAVTYIQNRPRVYYYRIYGWW
ncbi:MAG: hypothetical protein HUK14_01550 [Muribaculaceae bacterium]|nr:hypothetical protein [Muribaculaceae bacterium]